ncbi:methylmalonyl-CoA mutase cobalamin-binding subunit [Saccharomonospora amisosensis]|uniref:Methylmalonyl-CoA mutase cobalamin-binding subunit n=1 Tax=Saccharomonospora amisosensis TaxID=1128677 RepID=A0A7X5UUV4_9PSEU|nr:hypothetical protein [Saccharomonospora amisosensis]NIJ14129.1 methylmalonyl-CoA mutase cobalamin-binding subunit [Saccharomonospora amisosensis]
MTRILLAELCQPHDVAIRAARALRDAGEEVVYTGVLGGLDEVLAVVDQEDPEALALAVGSVQGERLLEAIVTALSELPVMRIGIDTDTTQWSERGAICATGSCSRHRR